MFCAMKCQLLKIPPAPDSAGGEGKSKGNRARLRGLALRGVVVVLAVVDLNDAAEAAGEEGTHD